MTVTLRSLVELRQEMSRRSFVTDNPDRPGHCRGARSGWALAVEAMSQLTNQVHDDETTALRMILETLEEDLRRTRSLSEATMPREQRNGRIDAVSEAAAMVQAVIDGNPVPAAPRTLPRPQPHDPLADWSGYPRVPLPEGRDMTDVADLALFLGGNEDSFTGDLLRLIYKADPVNLNRLAAGFPREVRAAMLFRALAPVPGDTLKAVLEFTANLGKRSTDG